jgi:hypothetical protein
MTVLRITAKCDRNSQPAATASAGTGWPSHFDRVFMSFRQTSPRMLMMAPQAP